MINLNEEKYNTLPTENELLKVIPSYEIFRYYLGRDLSLGVVIKSPLRDDKHPSFSLFPYPKDPDILLYRDFGKNGPERIGNAIQFVSRLFNISIPEAIVKIQKEISFRGEFIGETENKPPTDIRIRGRSPEQKDINYWKSYGVDKDTLDLFDCVPLNYFFINDKVFKADNYSYAFPEFKDERCTYKIYQPYNSHGYKFVNNHPSSVHQGYRQLPKEGDVLLITKSYKDVMCLRSSFKMISIGIQGESIVIKESVINEYLNRFKRVYTFFDNDSTGRKLAEIYENLYKIKSLFIPDKYYPIKDISDYYFKFKTEEINFIKL